MEAGFVSSKSSRLQGIPFQREICNDAAARAEKSLTVSRIGMCDLLALALRCVLAPGCAIPGTGVPIQHE